MPSLSVDRNFEGKTARECYDAAVKALPQAGFELIKLRELAYLVIGRRGELTCTVMAWPGANARVTLTLEAESCSLTELNAHAEKVFEALGSTL